MDKDEEEQRINTTRIQDAEKKLYSASSPDIVRASPRHDGEMPEEEEAPVSRSWAPDKKEAPHYLKTDAATKLFTKILIGSIVFFLLAVAAAVVIYIYGNNTVSSNNISIDITSASSVPASDPFSFDISVENRNKTDLVGCNITIDYPDGSKRVDNDTMDLVNDVIDVGTLHSGEIIKKTADVRLFGPENSVKTIKATFHYKLAGSNAVFYKDASENITLRVAPVVLSVDALKEISNNQQVTLKATVTSNSNNVLKGAALDITYPFGFTFQQSNMETADGNTGNFALGDIQPNESKEVDITGIITGNDAEDKVFKYDLGTADGTNPEKVTTQLVTYDHDMVISSDFLATSITFDSQGGSPQAGSNVVGTISWRNTLAVPITDATFSLKLNGDIIDQNGVAVSKGYYQSNAGTISWDKLSDSELAEISPGQSGQLSFSLPLISYQDALAKNMTNPKVGLVLDVAALRLTDNNVTENITSSLAKDVPVVTSVSLKGSSLNSSGPIPNSGPIPPKANQKTTYTLAFTVSNSLNDVTAAQLDIPLPPYVTFENVVSPSTESVTLNKNTNHLTWNIGKLPAYTGYGTKPARTVYIKVGIIPSANQVGQSPFLTISPVFMGNDDFAGDTITETIESITTATNDPASGYGDGQVVN